MNIQIWDTRSVYVPYKKKHCYVPISFSRVEFHVELQRDMQPYPSTLQCGELGWVAPPRLTTRIWSDLVLRVPVGTQKVCLDKEFHAHTCGG